MKRRTFFKWIGAGAAAFFALPARLRGTTITEAADQPATLHAVADAVLPTSLGAAGIDTAVKEFEDWVHEYKAGAEMSSGYGFIRLRVEPPDPSVHYAEQLRTLETAALSHGAGFADSSRAVRRGLLQDALAAARVDSLPRRPDGGHVATDLMAFFFFVSSRGHDFLYNAAIGRDACRGLKNSGNRPISLR